MVGSVVENFVMIVIVFKCFVSSFVVSGFWYLMKLILCVIVWFCMVVVMSGGVVGCGLKMMCCGV